jgi:hypothetical protein
MRGDLIQMWLHLPPRGCRWRSSSLPVPVVSRRPARSPAVGLLSLQIPRSIDQLLVRCFGLDRFIADLSDRTFSPGCSVLLTPHMSTVILTHTIFSLISIDALVPAIAHTRTIFSRSLSAARLWTLSSMRWVHRDACAGNNTSANGLAV